MSMKTTIVVAALALAAGTSQAGVVAVGGATQQIAPPASCALGALESNTVTRVFPEVQNLTLAAALNVDANGAGTYNSAGSLNGGAIAPGTTVNSYYLYSDPVGGSNQVYEGFVRFDEQILGVIVLRAGLNGSDLLLGNPLTTYADNEARGLELSTNSDRFSISLSEFELRYVFRTSTATDDIRIITVPAPATLALAGMGGLAAMRRRRSVR
jgi:hypothetical protein